MTDKIEVPRELLEELRDCASDCYDYESTLAHSRGTRVNFYEGLVEQCDALLREAEKPEKHECCGNPAQCWEPCGQLGKSEAHTAVAPDDITLWTLSYRHAGLTYSVWLWGAAEEVESHAARLGWQVDGEVIRVVDEITQDVYYEKEDVQ